MFHTFTTRVALGQAGDGEFTPQTSKGMLNMRPGESIILFHGG